MPAEDSSSASVSFWFLMFIKNIKQTLPGVYEITPDTGSAFFLRKDYLSLISEEKLLPFGYGRLDVDLENIQPKEGDSGFFNEAETEDLFKAALVYSVEKAAMTYLARAEHCRSGLYKKLLAKNFDKNACNMALDYLESVNYLNDYRFSLAWLRNRAIDHFEGRTRLFAELLNRGIDKNIAKQSLDEFFTTHDELEACRKSFEKTFKTKKDPQKIKASLLRKGFTLKEISTVFKENSISEY